MPVRRRSGIESQTRALAENAAAVAAGLREAVSIPAAPHGRPAVVMLMGLPGVGKSHTARLLAARIGAAHVASDDIRARVFVAPSYTPQESAMVFRVVEELVLSLLAEGHRVIVDATNLRRSQRAGIEAAARDRGIPLAHVLVSAEEGEVLARLASRRRARAQHDRSDADERVYAAMRDHGLEEPDGGYLVARNGPGLEGEVERVAGELEAIWSH